MPELRDEMYCSQQICIPPSFPYLLRQYAKAAIRSQPSDLLRWSMAYFRCLSLNLRPPVKPRLEYPIPKSYFGITPGWLKALTFQLQNNLYVSFKVLWDRWIGACLQHQNLIEILCLGQFTDHTSVPWYRVVALCTSLLADNLTQTMIMLCEILTEEPEGGSATIALETFLDLYKYLALIDASQPQIFKNLYFTDSLLSLYREPPAEVVEKSISEVTTVEEEESVAEEEEKEIVEETGPVEDLVGVVISCPDIAPDDYKTEEDFLNRGVVEEKRSIEETDEQAEEDNKGEGLEKKLGPKESVDTDINYMPPREQEEPDEDVEKLEVSFESHPEKAQEVTQEVVPSLSTQQQLTAEISARPSEEGGEEEEESSDKGSDVYVEVIAGIGPIVPSEMITAVEIYMRECAITQHGLIMPRNIRHYSCPPLEKIMPGQNSAKKDECEEMNA